MCHSGLCGPSTVHDQGSVSLCFLLYKSIRLVYYYAQGLLRLSVNMRAHRTDLICPERPDSATVHEIDPIFTSYQLVRTGLNQFLRKTLIFRVPIYAHNLLSTGLVLVQYSLVRFALVFTVAALPPQFWLKNRYFKKSFKTLTKGLIVPRLIFLFQKRCPQLDAEPSPALKDSFVFNHVFESVHVIETAWCRWWQ